MTAPGSETGSAFGICSAATGFTFSNNLLEVLPKWELPDPELLGGAPAAPPVEPAVALPDVLVACRPGVDAASLQTGTKRCWSSLIEQAASRPPTWYAL